MDIRIRHRTESLGDAQCTDVDFWRIGRLIRAVYITMESHSSCSGYSIANQPVDIVECKFSIEFRRCHRHHDHCLVDAATYKVT